MLLALLQLAARSLTGLPSGGRRSGIYRLFRAVFPVAVISVMSVSCTENDTDKYDAGDANLRILSMYALRDAECGTTHTLSGFILGKATRTSVDLCVSQLYMLTCTEWQVSDGGLQGHRYQLPLKRRQRSIHSIPVTACSNDERIPSFPAISR